MDKRLCNCRQRVVILGLDGVPCSLIQRFARDGIMPNLGRLLDIGTLCPMTASLPEVSSTSWSTFMTGVNPGKHGIYGFMDLHPDSYSLMFPNFNDLKSQTIWDIAGNNGKRSVIINIPQTYPAKPINGLLVSGFVALDLRKASYPESFYEYLKNVGYRLDVDAGKAAAAIEDFKQDITQTFKKRTEAINYLVKHQAWDLFVATITETDRLHHYFWSAYEDSSNNHHDYFINFYRELDNFIGEFTSKFEEDANFLIVSDHGFTSIKKEVYLNSLLRENGLLQFSSSRPTSFRDITGTTKAFVLDPSRVYVHRNDIYKYGCVSIEDRYKILEDVKSILLDLTFEGENVVKDIFLKEDIYWGDHMSKSPDLVILANDGYDLKGTISKPQIFGNSILTGSHTHGNATFYINKKIKTTTQNIIDVGPTVLRLLGISGGNLDGSPIE